MWEEPEFGQISSNIHTEERECTATGVALKFFMFNLSQGFYVMKAELQISNRKTETEYYLKFLIRFVVF